MNVTELWWCRRGATMRGREQRKRLSIGNEKDPCAHLELSLPGTVGACRKDRHPHDSATGNPWRARFGDYPTKRTIPGSSGCNICIAVSIFITDLDFSHPRTAESSPASPLVPGGAERTQACRPVGDYRAKRTNPGSSGCAICIAVMCTHTVVKFSHPRRAEK